MLATSILLISLLLKFGGSSCSAMALCQSGRLQQRNEMAKVILFINTTCKHEGFLSETVLPDVKLALNVVNDSLHPEMRELSFSTIDLNMDSNGSSSLSFLLDYVLPTANFSAEAVLYPGCLLYNQILTDISRRLFNLSVVTYAFPTPSVQPFFHQHYQMFPSEKHLATGVASFITYFNWKRAVILTQDISIFTSILEEFQDFLENMSVNLTNKILIERSDHRLLSDMDENFPPDNRVFVLNMYPVFAREVLCEAFNSGRFYPGYVWITYGWYSDQWWEETRMNKLDNCSNEEIIFVLKGAIAVTHYPNDTAHLNQSTSHVHSFRTYASSAYDAVMFLAQKLFSFSGPQITFNEYGVRNIDYITFFQYRNGSDQFPVREVIGSMQPPGNLTLREGEDEFSLWPNGVPSDGTPETVENYPLLPLMVVIYTAATAGILFAIVCLIFNIVFRNKKLVRLTSPNINYIIILGAIVFYASIYEFAYLPDTPKAQLIALCNIRLWFTSIGSALTYVPINVKMWRVFHICRKPKPSMKNVFIKDCHLILIISFFVILDLILLIIVTAVDNSRYTVKIIPDKEHPGTSVNDDGITISYTVSRCHSATEPYWKSVLFGYKLLMQAIGVFLAFNIRKVKIKGLNDSKEISFILYITTVLIGIAILVAFVFGDYINVFGGTYGLGITTATTVILTFIFVPKMYGLYRDPKGEKIFSPTNHSSAIPKTSDLTEDNKVVIAALKKRIKELETKFDDGERAKDNLTVVSAVDAVGSSGTDVDCSVSVE